MVIFPAVLVNNRWVLAGLLAAAETDMNRFGSHPNHENRPLYEGPPPQGLSEARRAGSFFEFLVTDLPRGRPVGGCGNHRN